MSNKFKRFASAITAATLVVSSLPLSLVNAATITDRKITVGSSAASASTSYTLVGTFPTTGSTIKSIQVEFCTTASGGCSASDLDANSATIGSITGLTGTWTDESASNSLKITNTTGSTPTNPVTIPWSTVVNPTTSNQTYYGRITTYANDDYTSAIDSGVVALSTTNSITVTASVDESITFCTGTSGITSTSCAGATGTSVDLGTLTDQATESGTSQIGVSTNAGSGYAITYAGSTLTNGSYTIDAMATKTTSSIGSEQFGINAVANSTPSVGSDPAGAGSATASADYATADQFRYVSGSTLVSQASADDFRLFTVSYIANVSGTTEPGVYTTSINYVATATF